MFKKIVFVIIITVPGIILHAENIPADTTGNSKSYLSFGLLYSDYSSYSALKNDIPLKAGYPVFLSGFPSANIKYITGRRDFSQHFELTAGYFPSISSDNGTGKNYLLNEDESSLFKLSLQYYFRDRIFTTGGFEFAAGFSSALSYENNSLYYKSGIVIDRWELSPAAGGLAQMQYSFSEEISADILFHSLFYIPYITFGNYKSSDEQGTIFESDYFPFIYQTIFKISFSYRLSGAGKITAGYGREYETGFSNDERSFEFDRIITFKLDRIHHYFIEYQFEIP